MRIIEVPRADVEASTRMRSVVKAVLLAISLLLVLSTCRSAATAVRCTISNIEVIPGAEIIAERLPLGFVGEFGADVEIEFSDPGLWSAMIEIDESDSDNGDENDVIILAQFDIFDSSDRIVRLPTLKFADVEGSQNRVSWPSIETSGPVVTRLVTSDSETLLTAEQCSVSTVGVWSPSPTIEADEPRRLLWEAGPTQ